MFASYVSRDDFFIDNSEDLWGYEIDDQWTVQNGISNLNLKIDSDGNGKHCIIF